ncbi:MAG: glycosyltransferase involved in cell wall biosynthesis [Flammeovirgaceae bacterium]|jgi:glycosyltransferase involved in cell wall biosynthesis
MKVIFLYTELADYIRNCFERLAASGAEVHVVAYPVNPEAPFEFGEASVANYYDRTEFDEQGLKDLVRGINAQAVFCSGWIDEGYISTMQSVPLDTNRVLISDNAFMGGLRDRASSIRAKSKFKRLFDYAFVSGEPQKVYAEKMGFKRNEIFTGFYTADEASFAALSTQNDKGDFPKRFVYVGRYLDFKGVFDLWSAFSELNPKDWELHCAGTGASWDQRMEQPSIFHHGFLQPLEMKELMAKGGIFVLPSHKEPWGVVVHEFAAAGFPLLLSDKVNSGSEFLKDNQNGFAFEAKNKKDLERVLAKMIDLSDSALCEMSSESRELGINMTVSRWLKTVEVLANRRK